jgi:hypothetical protein
MSHELWKPGESGNKSGRPKTSEEFKEICKTHSVIALKGICEIATDKKHRDRLRACEYIVDRTYGKATQPIEGTGDELKAIIHRTIINDPRISGHSTDTKANNPVQCST